MVFSWFPRVFIALGGNNIIYEYQWDRRCNREPRQRRRIQHGLPRRKKPRLAMTLGLIPHLRQS